MVGYRYSGGHFKETGKGAPGGCLASPVGRALAGAVIRYQASANRKPASAMPMRSIDQSPTLRPRSLPVRAALCTTIALPAFQRGNPPTLSYDELFARY
jgi:hypothetical protein